MQIDHDPHEPKIDRRPESFRLIFVLLAVGWGCLLYTHAMDWVSVVAGLASGMMFMLWASIRFKHLW